MLTQEDPKPSPRKVPPAQLLNTIQAIYPLEKEALGVVVLALKPWKSTAN
jgi:hypothetical protein